MCLLHCGCLKIVVYDEKQNLLHNDCISLILQFQKHKYDR